MDHGRILALETVERLISQYGGAATVEVELAEGQELPVDYQADLAELGADNGERIASDVADRHDRRRCDG
jgi:hypothetical protein